MGTGLENVKALHVTMCAAVEEDNLVLNRQLGSEELMVVNRSVNSIASIDGHTMQKSPDSKRFVTTLLKIKSLKVKYCIDVYILIIN